MIGPGLSLAVETLNALAAHIAVLDEGGSIVFVNDAWLRFARDNGGAPSAESHVGVSYLGTCRAAARLGDSDAARALSGIDEVRRGQRQEYRQEYPCHAPGRARWFRMSVTRLASPSASFVAVAHEDITNEKEGQIALQEAERLLRSVLEALPVGVWIMDATGRIVHGNAAGLRIWGGARYVGPADFGEYKGWWHDSGQPIAAEDWAAARAIRNGETSLGEEIDIECFDGTRKTILNSAIPLLDDDGRVTGAIIVNQDITARKHAEAEREAMLREQAELRAGAQEANRMKDDFIAMLSHELRTPLGSVLGWTAILKDALPDEAAARRAAEAIDRNARIQAKLLEDTLDLSRIARGKLTLERSAVDMASLAAEVVEAMRPAAIGKAVALDAHASGGPTGLHGDPIRLRQVVWNLVANALKFTPAGGWIRVETRGGAGAVEVAVRDNGAGIAPAFMPFLFDRFRQGSDAPDGAPPGLGLGLALAREIVERHGGAIAAESAGEGRGATFIVRIPTGGPSSGPGAAGPGEEEDRSAP